MKHKQFQISDPVVNFDMLPTPTLRKIYEDFLALTVRVLELEQKAHKHDRSRKNKESV